MREKLVFGLIGLLAFLMVATASAYATIFVIFALIIDGDHAPTRCDDQQEFEAFCQIRYNMHGDQRQSSARLHQSRCCIMEQRGIMDNTIMPFRVLACPALPATPLPDCAKVQSFEQFVWLVDGQNLYPDPSWPGHISSLSYDRVQTVKGPR